MNAITSRILFLKLLFFYYFTNIIVIVLGSSAVDANVAPAQGMWRVVDRPLFVRLLRFNLPPLPCPRATLPQPTLADASLANANFTRKPV